MDVDTRARLFKRVERITRIPLLVLSIVFLIVVALPFLTQLSAPAYHLANRIMWLIWGIFVAELLLKIYLAPERWNYVRGHWPDVLTVAVPWLRAIRIVTAIIALLRTWEEARLALRQRTFSLVGMISLLTVVSSALIVHAVERDADGPIQSFADGLWWSVATITTVGYGDVYPVTPVGRSVAVVLMITGISLFGVLAARVAAFFVEEEQRQHEDPRLDAIAQRLERIEQQLAQREDHDASSPPASPSSVRRRQPVDRTHV